MGRGDVPATGSIIIAHIKGFLADGTVFDDTRAVGSPLVMSAGVRPREVCEGLEEGLLTMRAGSIRLLVRACAATSLSAESRHAFARAHLAQRSSPCHF